MLLHPVIPGKQEQQQPVFLYGSNSNVYQYTSLLYPTKGLIMQCCSELLCPYWPTGNHDKLMACSFGWWLMAGAGLF
jgi:hypothetical protein